METIPILAKEWRVTFDFKATSYSKKEWASVLHMTIGGDKTNAGDRTPALWMRANQGVAVSTALDGRVYRGKSFPGKNPPINEWASIEVSQIREGYKYIFSLVIMGETLWSVENSKPSEFSDVKVFLSSKWASAQAGSIRRFKIENKIPGDRNLGPLYYS